MKKLLSVVLIITLMLGMCSGLSGCGQKEENEVLTRAEWIDTLAQQYNLNESYSQDPVFTDVKSSNPYFPQIQACAEWQIIEKADTFNPTDKADNQFAVVSAVKAIGITRLEKSDYKTSLKTDDEILSFFKTQSGLSVSEGKALTKKQADEILVKAQAISDGIILPQVYEIDYKDNVKQMDLTQVGFSADGKSATLKGGEVNVGDIIIVEPNEYLPDGKYVKVTANDNGALTYTEAEFEEICENYEVSGTYEPKVLSVRPLSGEITVDSFGGKDNIVRNQSNNDSSNIYATPLIAKNGSFGVMPMAKVYANAGSVNLSVNKSLGSGITITGTVSVNFDKITVDMGKWINLNPFSNNGLRDSYLKIENTVRANLTVSGNFKQTIKLASVGLSLYGVIGVYADLSLSIGFDGSISVGIEVKTTEEITIPPWSIAKLKTRTYDPTVTAHLDVHGYIRPDLCASVKILGHKVAYVGVYSGIEARAVADATLSSGSFETCLDLKAWVPLIVYYGYDFIITKGSDRIEFWNEKNSPWQPHLHIENGKVVDICTRTGETVDSNLYEDDDADVPRNIDDDLVDSAINDGFGDGISLAAFYVAISPNTTDRLVVTHIPKGYHADDLVFSSDNPSSVTVDNSGNINARGEGTVIIKVSTSDGKYEQFCTVSVKLSFGTSDFRPLA